MNILWLIGLLLLITASIAKVIPDDENMEKPNEGLVHETTIDPMSKPTKAKRKPTTTTTEQTTITTEPTTITTEHTTIATEPTTITTEPTTITTESATITTEPTTIATEPTTITTESATITTEQTTIATEPTTITTESATTTSEPTTTAPKPNTVLPNQEKINELDIMIEDLLVQGKTGYWIGNDEFDKHFEKLIRALRSGVKSYFKKERAYNKFIHYNAARLRLEGDLETRIAVVESRLDSKISKKCRTYYRDLRRKLKFSLNGNNDLKSQSLELESEYCPPFL